MGNIACVNKESRSQVHKCNYAWYQMYTRFMMTLAPAKHEGVYNYECLRDPCIPDGCRGGRTSQSLIAKVHASLSVNLPPYVFASNYSRIWFDANKLKYSEYQQTIKSLDLNLVNKINQELKHCVNPKHQSKPVYESDVNYRRKFRIEYLTMHKKTKFTAADEKKLTKYKHDYDILAEKRKRYIQCVLYITILKAKDCMLTPKDVKKMNDLCDKIKLLERKQRIVKLMENYE